MNYGNKIFVYEGIPDIYFTAFLSTDLMSGVTLRRYLLPDIMDNGNFKGSFFPPFNDEINTSTHAHTCTHIYVFQHLPFWFYNFLLIFLHHILVLKSKISYQFPIKTIRGEYLELYTDNFHFHSNHSFSVYVNSTKIFCTHYIVLHLLIYYFIVDLKKVCKSCPALRSRGL